ncbi:MAG: hypothetical protein JWN13_408 [Betaproteobacteria bacterium]|jgi:hypothetical protein|nr:hypothetical protein [Betaproteobacteria bacterium]MEA3158411.1 hypothetical protein [Betaproteobacteria bacterium]
MHKIFAVILMCLATPSLCFAESKVPLEVVHSGKDRAGQLFVAELKEIMRSHSARPVTDRQRPRIVVLVATADGDSQLRGSSSAISISILYDAPRMPGEGAFLKSVAQSCSRENAAICARNAAADIEYEVSLLRRNWPALWASL